MASKVWKSALEEEEKAFFPLSCQNEEEALDRINHIIHRSPEEFGIHHSRWRLCDLRAVCQDWLFVTTDPGLWQVLKRLGIRYKQARAYLRSPDPDYVAKLQEIQQIIQCSAEDPQHIVVIFLDELTFYRQPSLAQAYERLGKAQPLAKLGHRAISPVVLSPGLIFGKEKYCTYNVQKSAWLPLDCFMSSWRKHSPRCTGHLCYPR